MPSSARLLLLPIVYLFAQTYFYVDPTLIQPFFGNITVYGRVEDFMPPTPETLHQVSLVEVF